MNLTIVDGDLLDQDVDVIVNAWNRNIFPWWLLLLQGVSGAIKKRAGSQPFRELARMGILPLGHAVETSPGMRGPHCPVHPEAARQAIEPDGAGPRQVAANL